MHKSQDFPSMWSINQETLPAIGFIVYSNSEYQYICAGFLRLVEGGFAQIDTLVTNPDIDSYIRHEGINLLVNKLLETAKSLKLKGIYAHTNSQNIIKRAVDTGFHVVNQSIIALPF